MKALKLFKTALLATVLLMPLAHANDLNIGVIDSMACVEKSYLGQNENQKFEDLRNNMIATLEKQQQKVQEIDKKLSDTNYRDTITPEAEEQLMAQRAELIQELQMLNQQAQQSFDQASQKFSIEMKNQINKVAEYIAREKGFDLIIDKQNCYYFKSPSDITPLIIQELNRHFTPETPESK